MRTGWITQVGRFKVEHVPCPHPRVKVDVAMPPKGMLHTTQGASIEGALAVFLKHFAPHFTLGLDAKKRIRVMQHIPLGMIAAALENDPGGVETNRIVRVQVEIVGFSRPTPWFPVGETAFALKALVAAMGPLCQIPFRHPVVKRDPTLWNRTSGWLGHTDVPENVHWDPGALQYGRLWPAAAETIVVPDLRGESKRDMPFTRKVRTVKAAKAIPVDDSRPCAGKRWR